MLTTDHQVRLCPACGVDLHASTSIVGDYTPQPGDYAVCYKCRAFLSYADSLQLIKLGPAEFKLMDTGTQILVLNAIAPLEQLDEARCEIGPIDLLQ